ncbi:hypothetical protein [Polaribacter sargassicola]|uniref:hypothetical protein n=1 Tax=Polaribacter sargassicola TaxID=2836891 RepID=UPI001F1E9E87|nr:hypothetical protein [Polaribacter sp. DS7-9]MCG1034857.1 hypothetical protein [Polaribacter sp. DS7-9]
MKSILILILAIGFTSYAQKPILIINNSVIASIDLLNKTSSQNILELEVNKEKKLSSTYLFVENEKSGGIIEVNIKEKFKVKSQKELNSFFGLNEKNDIYVNGYLIENKSFNILSESIVAIELVNANNFKLNKKFLNIKTE